jgi:hypothetical protein
VFGVRWLDSGRGGRQLGRRGASRGARDGRCFRRCHAVRRETGDDARPDSSGVHPRECLAPAGSAIGTGDAAASSACRAVAAGARRTGTTA